MQYSRPSPNKLRVEVARAEGVCYINTTIQCTQNHSAASLVNNQTLPLLDCEAALSEPDLSTGPMRQWLQDRNDSAIGTTGTAPALPPSTVDDSLDSGLGIRTDGSEPTEPPRLDPSYSVE